MVPFPSCPPPNQWIARRARAWGMNGFSGKALASAFFKLRSRFVQVRNEVKELRLLFEVFADFGQRFRLVRQSRNRA